MGNRREGPNTRGIRRRRKRRNLRRQGEREERKWDK
jgi:hypothetical protein